MQLLTCALCVCAGLIQQVQAVLANTKLMVLIRPRGGDFVYTADEINVCVGW